MSDALWAPWRIGYIIGADKPDPSAATHEALEFLAGADRNCFLCQGSANVLVDDTAAVDRSQLVVWRTALSIAMLNRYPYNNGHLLVAPRRHVAALAGLGDEEHLDLMRVITRLCAVLEKVMKPEGFNIGLNLGRVAGAGLPGHLHWHIVPRYGGDTNFMPVLADVNVIPQSLAALHELLGAALESKS